MDIWGIVGITASVLVISSYIPQIIKSYRTKSTKDISIALPVILFFASVLWALYGIHLNDPILITLNTMMSVLTLLILIMKLKFG